MMVWGLAFVLSLGVSAALTPLVLRFALRRQLLDQPGERKVHVRAVPRLGGIAVSAAVATALLTLPFIDTGASGALASYPQHALGFGAGAVAIVLLGIFDDLRGANARLKFAVQGLVAIGMWLAGFRIEAIGGSLGLEAPLAALSLPITVLWIVGVVNAVNLIDGLDGLASGLSLIAAIAFFVVGVERNHVLVPLLMAAVAGALVGFLFFNFNPARIFLGDSGSLFLGFVVAVASIWTHMKGPMTATLGILPFLVLVVPLLDTTLAILRRLRRGQSPFSPDREHLHHRLMERGLSHRGAVLALYAVAGASAAAGGATLSGSGAVRTIGVVVAAAVVVVLVRHVGLFGAEVEGARALLDDVDGLAQQVRTARNPSQAWSQLEPAFTAVGASGASFVYGASAPSGALHWGAPPPGEDDDWEDLELPLRRGGWKGTTLVVRWQGTRDARVRGLHRRAMRRVRRALEAASSTWPEAPRNGLVSLSGVRSTPMPGA
jgi:UDP-GlcNAc:undecaprenyl-phosphate GlcNAc-1-phosphate transferase